MKSTKFVLALLVLLTALTLVFSGCGGDPGDDPSNMPGENTIEVILNSVAANGTPTTTSLTLTFSQAIAGLTENDIQLSGVSGITKGTLSASGSVYTLPISGFTSGGTLTVTVTKTGYNINKTALPVQIVYSASGDIEVTFLDITADGEEFVTTTKITLTFDKDIDGFSVNDIKLESDYGAEKGTLTKKSGTTGVYELTVSGFTRSHGVYITITKAGYTIKNNYYLGGVDIFLDPRIPVNFISLTADGSELVGTTKLTLTFDKKIEIATWDNINISLTPSNTGIEISGAEYTDTDGVYKANVNGVTQITEITIEVSRDGYIINNNSKKVRVYPHPVDNNSFVINFDYVDQIYSEIYTENDYPVIYRVSDPDQKTVTINIYAEDMEQYSSFSWSIDNNAVTGTGTSITLDADNAAYNFIGEHFLTLTGWKNGVPLSSTITFKVEY